MKKLKQKYTALKSNSYVMRIATLMSGTLMAQAVMLGFMPLLTRLYTPEEFGVYSLFFSIASIVGLVSSLKYDQAIMLPKSEKNAQALVFLAVLISCMVASIVTIAIYFFEPIILSYYAELKNVVWLLPLGILLIGMLQIFNAYSSRQQFYRKMAAVRVVNAVTVVGVQSISKSLLEIKGFILTLNEGVFDFSSLSIKFNGLVLNFSGFIFDFDGLILGKLIADFICFFLLIKYHLKKHKIKINSVSIRRIRYIAKRYDQFPKYQSLTVFLNAISQNMPILLLGMFYSAEIAGFYALTVRILKAPMGLIGASTKEVYYQKASKMYAQGEGILGLYVKTTTGLAKIFVLPLLVVLFFGELIFSLVFGGQWATSGIIAQILIFWFAIGFINAPALITYSILGVQKTQMKLELISLILRFLAIYISYLIYPSYLVSITAFMIVSIGVNSFSLVYIFRKLKNRGKEYDVFS